MTLEPVRDGELCMCPDAELQLLRDLVANRVPHYDACLIALGLPPRNDAPMWVQNIWARHETRRIANRVRHELGIAELPVRFEDCDKQLAARLQAMPWERLQEGLRKLARAARQSGVSSQKFTAAFTKQVKPLQVDLQAATRRAGTRRR